MAGIAGDLFLKLYLVILVSGKLALIARISVRETNCAIQWIVIYPVDSFATF